MGGGASHAARGGGTDGGASVAGAEIGSRLVLVLASLTPAPMKPLAVTAIWCTRCTVMISTRPCPLSLPLRHRDASDLVCLLNAGHPRRTEFVELTNRRISRGDTGVAPATAALRKQKGAPVAHFGESASPLGGAGGRRERRRNHHD